MSLAQAILALIGTLAGIVAVVINRRNDAALTRASDIYQAQRELSRALAAKHFDDAAFWARRLRELSSVPLQPAPDPVAQARPEPSAPPRTISPILLLCLILPLSGCLTPPPPQRPVLIIGQRVLAPDPGSTITVPPLTPPASQWYLVDDIGLSLWLGISLPAPLPSSVLPSSVIEPRTITIPNQEPRTKNQER
jgi:hypothetical protein